MNKFALILVCTLLIMKSIFVSAAGLGDTVKDVRSQYGSKVSVDETYYVFSKPPRVARIDIASRNFFGNTVSFHEFIRGVKPLLPVDAKPIAAYAKSSPKKDIFTFKSASLANLPNIKDGVIDSPPGTFTIYVNYEGERVINCAISMGLPNEVDLSSTKKIKNNPFK